MDKKINKQNKIIIYSILLTLGLTIFILEIFVYQKPDGIVGLIICILSIYLILGSIIKLCKLSSKFENTFLSLLDIIFWLP